MLAYIDDIIITYNFQQLHSVIKHDNRQQVLCRSDLAAGGGIPESKRAAELSELLGVKILPAQVILQTDEY